MNFEKYQKINSVFKRDNNGKFTEEFSQPEFKYLKECIWDFDEKIDGTNIRIHWDGQGTITFGGRTDRAQLPADLYKELSNLFKTENLLEIFEETEVILYGEGYGAKIQKVGSLYIPNGVSFVLFDIKVGNMWLKKDDVRNLADKLGLLATPSYGEGTLSDAIKITQKGFNSHWGDFPAEGLILRPKIQLFDRMGKRVITKLKIKDWK